jgi:hypothetical protein
MDKNVTAFHMIWLNLEASELSHKTCQSEQDGLHYPKGNSNVSFGEKHRNAYVREFLMPVLLTCESFAVISVETNGNNFQSVFSHQGSYFLLMVEVDIYCSWQTLSTNGVCTNPFAARSGVRYLYSHCCNTTTNSNCYYQCH